MAAFFVGKTGAIAGIRRSQGIKKDTRFSLVSLFLIAETGFEPATSGL